MVLIISLIPPPLTAYPIGSSFPLFPIWNFFGLWIKYPFLKAFFLGGGGKLCLDFFSFQLTSSVFMDTRLSCSCLALAISSPDQRVGRVRERRNK